MWLIGRAIAGVLGGYFVANLCAIALSYLSAGKQADSVMLGLVSSFFIYTIVVLWVFGAKTQRQVWLGLGVACLVCIVCIFVLMPDSVWF